MNLLSVSPVTVPQFLTINRSSSLPLPAKSLIALPNRNNSRHNHCITARAIDPEERISSFGSTVNVVADETKEEEKNEEKKEEEDIAVDGESEETVSGELLKKFDLKLDSDDSYYFLIYGTAALVAIWLSSAVVGAIDSIPLFPKMMEVVGLVYTIWFSYRYLLFKENRNEFITKVEELKKQMFGDNQN